MRDLYIRLAAVNMKNSRQFYVPYLLTGILSVAMFYTMMGIQFNSGISSMRGAVLLKGILGFGTYVIGFFVSVFLFYTNSFIIKRRKKELGLYNILGMEKRHIAKVLAAEIFFAGAISILGGTAAGIAFNKFVIMCLYRLVGIDTPIKFEISGGAILYTMELFLGIYMAIFLYDMMQIRLAKPIDLLHGKAVGEKEPKTKLLMSVIGVLCLGIGYAIAITCESPLEALTMFFVAVLLVIIGTYALFLAGSITFLKALRKNKAYYYQTRHFISVSGLIYRMKQNAVGLANICVLSTMVLVVISTTVCMYVGIDDELNSRYQGEINIRDSIADLRADDGGLEHEVEAAIRDNGRQIISKYEDTTLRMAGACKDGTILFDREGMEKLDASDISMIYLQSKESYEEEYDRTLPDLSAGEVAVIGTPFYEQDSLSMLGKIYQVREATEFSPRSDESYMADLMNGMYYIIFSDEEALEEFYMHQKEELGDSSASFYHSVSFEIDGSREEKLACDQAVGAKLEAIKAQDGQRYENLYAEYREQSRSGFYMMNGGFLFLGIFLGLMFLVVTVLIIFYKQISEGYEDRSRFEIMQKVGMSRQEVKDTVRVQVRLMFFLPIVTAAIHVTAAFPMIKRLLVVMNLENGTLFAICLAGTVLVFAAIYFLVFSITSGNYFRIVGEHNA